MHVIDIEQRFEQLTNINPKLSKSDIVAQIKEFIRITHEKIKKNYSNKKNGKIKGKKIVKSQSMKKIVILSRTNTLCKSLIHSISFFSLSRIQIK